MTTTKPNPAARRKARLAEQAQAAKHGDDTPAASVATVDDQSYVPPMDVFESYVGRSLPGGVDYIAVFEHAKTEHVNLLIEGPTGSGKTHAVRAYAAKRQVPFYAVSSNVGLEPSQLFGKFVPNPETGGFEWVDGPVTTVVRHGGVLLLNEVNFIPARIATVLFSLLDHRREMTLLDNKGEVIKAHPDLLIVADMNPDYEGTQPLNKAFRNRFGIQLTWDYDPSVEARLVECVALRSLAKEMRQAHADGTYETPTSTNALVEFEKLRVSLGYEFAVYNFVQHFQPHEREAVQLVFSTHERNLRDEYEAIDRRKSGKADPEPEPVAPSPVEEDTYDATWGVDTDELSWVFEAASA